LFFESRRLLWVWWTQPARAMLESGPDVFTVDTHPETYTFRWLYSQLYIYSCQLSNVIAVSSDEHLDLEGSRTFDATGAASVVNRILALALLTLLSASCTKILVAGQPLRPGSDLMLERLGSALKSPYDLLTRDNNHDVDWNGLDRALLWCSAIGATVEQILERPTKPASATKSSQTHFVEWFGNLVQLMRLKSKDAVAQILERFVYNDRMLPYPELWEEALRPHETAT
jgi:hypothetical protein